MRENLKAARENRDLGQIGGPVRGPSAGIERKQLIFLIPFNFRQFLHTLHSPFLALPIKLGEA